LAIVGSLAPFAPRVQPDNSLEALSVENDPSYFRIPDSRAEIENIVFLLESNREKTNLSSFVNADFSMIPALFPIVVTMGAMGFLKIELSVATAMAFAVAIGLTVDNTIHLIWNLKKYMASGMQYREAAASALQNTGSSAITSSLVLAGGFMSFSFSSV
jgi:riboflavin transporter FmnP